MAEEPPYFREARAAGRLVVTEAPKFELDAYIANYRGKTRIQRLHFIGTVSTQLYFEALKAAIGEAKRGKDVGLYQKVASALYEIMPDDPDATLDSIWISRTTKEVKAETDRLEQELKGYKNNLIKESIRMGCEDLGQHYHLIGDFANAIKSYSKEREVVQTTSHMIIMYLSLVYVAIDQGNWLVVQSTVQKLHNLQQRPEEAAQVQAKMAAAMGLAQLATGHYQEAAYSFLGTDPRMVQAKLDDPTDPDAYNEILTPNDIAIYGGLCALASMDRNELQTHVLNNTTFRNYLELEPHIRRAISFFVSSKYSSCLNVLESHKTDFLLDFYLHRHIDEIYFRIRSKAIVQYFVPYSCVTLKALASAFNTDETTIESTLVNMIGEGSLDARIDLEHRVLLARQIDERREVHQEAIAMAKEYERTAHLRILRMEIINAGLEVKSPKTQSMNSSQGGLGNAVGELFTGNEAKGKGNRIRSMFG